MLTNSMPILFILSGQVWLFALTDLLWSRSTSNAKNSRWEANSSSGKDANPIGHWKRDIEEDTSESDCLWDFKGIPDFYIWCIICLCCFCQTGETQTARKPGLIKKTVAYLKAGIIGGGLGQGCLKSGLHLQLLLKASCFSLQRKRNSEPKFVMFFFLCRPDCWSSHCLMFLEKILLAVLQPTRW